VTDRISDVVGECADGKGKLICIFGIAEEADNEVACAHVVGEVGIVPVAEGVIADVLDDTAAVSVSAGLIELGRGQAGIAGEKQGNDGVIPSEVDELLVGEQRIGFRAPLPGWREE